jgi:hypothetical protein
MVSISWHIGGGGGVCGPGGGGIIEFSPSW